MALLIFAAVLALSIPQAALLPLLDRDEPRFAEASREMVQSGNDIVPTFNGEPRYAKPPLIYWCQVIGYSIFGQNAFAARLPSLVATAATACLLFAWGVRLGGTSIGLAAAVSYAFCLQTMQQGRVATADAVLIFFMTLTAFAGWQIVRPKEAGQRCYPACYGVLALGFAGGFLAKGPEAWLPLVPLLWCVRGGERGAAVRVGASFIASLVVVLLWAIPALIRSHGEYFAVGIGHDVVDRMSGGNFQGHGASSLGLYLVTLPLYLVLFWISALPWSVLVVMHRRSLFRGWRFDLADSYLAFNAALIFAIFTLMTTKLPHYTLPAFPFLALLFARRWNSCKLEPGLPAKLGWWFGAEIAVLAAIFIPMALAHRGTTSPVGALMREAAGAVTPETSFAVVDFTEPSAIWEMRRVAKGYGSEIPPEGVIDFLTQPGPRAVILSSALWHQIDWNDFSSVFRAGSVWKVYTARGFNAAKGRFVDLTLVVKP